MIRDNKKTKILIIEDNEDLQMIYKLNFEKAGFEVKQSFNGIMGIADVINEKPDVVLLDIMMPQMNGFEVLEGILNNTSLKIPIVVCSNISQGTDRVKAASLGADLYLQKSDYQGAELVQKIEEFLNK